MSQKKLVMTVGLPRSGKSTWVATQSCPIVNRDSIRIALHGEPYISSAEPFVWAIAKVMVSALFVAGHDRVILDATNTSEERRDDWISSNWDREFVVFNTDMETCIARAVKGGKDYLVEPIERMAASYDTPSEEELGEDESITVLYDGGICQKEAHDLRR